MQCKVLAYMNLAMRSSHCHVFWRNLLISGDSSYGPKMVFMTGSIYIYIILYIYIYIYNSIYIYIILYIYI